MLIFAKNYCNMKCLVDILLLFMIAILGCSMTMQAERVVRYGYDATGNIVSRTLEVEEVEPTAMRSSQEEQETTTIENIDISSIKVYPNPVETFLNIEVGDTSAESLQIVIFTADGKIIEQTESKDRFIQLDFSDKSDGIYVVTIQFGDAVRSWRIIKK